MEIIKHSIPELERKLRTVRLKGFGEPLIYPEPVLINFRSEYVDQLQPCQNYWLWDNVKNILDLRLRVADAHGIDLLKLFSSNIGWVDIQIGPDEWMPFLPPVVETYGLVNGYRQQLLINDGIHRVMAAKLSGVNHPDCIITSRPEWPYYAYPLENGWDGVEKVEGELPDGFAKKRYRLPTKELYKQLYRDFNAVFPGVQKDRKQGVIS